MFIQVKDKISSSINNTDRYKYSLHNICHYGSGGKPIYHRLDRLLHCELIIHIFLRLLSTLWFLYLIGNYLCRSNQFYLIFYSEKKNQNKILEMNVTSNIDDLAF